jgi:GNAT superfamily N-acetyltransferase
MTLEVVPFAEEMLPEAGALFAWRQRRLREAEAELPGAFAEPDAGRAVVEAVWRREGAEGVAAVRGGRLGAFLIGERVVEEIWSRSGWVRFGGCGYTPEEGPEIIRDLYAALAAGWVRAGCFYHFALMPVGDPALVDRWFSLSFGIEQVFGLRSLESVDPTPSPDPPGVTIRLAETSDRSALEALSDVIWRHQVRSPCWGVHLPEREARHRAEWGNLVDEGDVTLFLAFEGEEPIGVQGYYPMEAGASDPTVPEQCVHLAAAGTRERARGRGIGRALTSRVLAHARSAGYRTCHTDWRSTNLLASRVWPRVGFQPVVYRLVRRVDSRIAWAREQ